MSQPLSAPWRVERVSLGNRPRALALLFRDLAPAEQHRLTLEAVGQLDRQPADTWGLFWATDGDRAGPVALAIEMPGRTASLFPPSHVDEPRLAQMELPQHVLAAIDTWLVDRKIAFAQCLLDEPSAAAVSLLTSAGYQRLCDLVFMAVPRANWISSEPIGSAPSFRPWSESDHERFAALVEASYAGTLDCPAMEGWRSIHDTLAGYAATGNSRTRYWWTIETHEGAAGVLLVAEHAATRQWELVYMGLIPTARGRGLARHALRFLQEQSRDVDSVYLAVDGANDPAIRLYASVGFFELARRTAFAKPLVTH